MDLVHGLEFRSMELEGDAPSDVWCPGTDHDDGVLAVHSLKDGPLWRHFACLIFLHQLWLELNLWESYK